VVGEIEKFISGVRGGFDTERVITITFTDAVGSTERAVRALGIEARQASMLVRSR
jgi:hypothetical protein